MKKEGQMREEKGKKKSFALQKDFNQIHRMVVRGC